MQNQVIFSIEEIGNRWEEGNIFGNLIRLNNMCINVLTFKLELVKNIGVLVGD